MKKTLSVALLGGALLLASAAHAQDSYVSVGVGQSEYSAGDGKEHKTAASLAYGQSLDQNFGYEIGYVNFGKLSGTADAPGGGGGSVSGSMRSQALYLSGVGTLPVSESLSLFGKLGVAAVYSKATGSFSSSNSSGSGSESESKAKLMAGVGVSYRFTKDVAATFEYQYFGKTFDNEVRLTAWTLGVKYGF